MPAFRKRRLHRNFRFREDGLHLDGNLAVDGDLAVNGDTVVDGDLEVTGAITPAPSPGLHAPTHEAGGGDPIQLDDLAAPSDNTDLDASTAAHGLLRKLPGDTTTFLRADGAFAAPVAAAHAATHEAGGPDPIQLDDLAAPSDNTDLDASTTAHGLLRKLTGSTTDFLRADGAFAAPAPPALNLRDATVELPYPASRTHNAFVPALGVQPSSDILLFLAGVPETQENASDMIELLGMRAVAASGSFEFQANFLMPVAGNLEIRFLVA